MRLIVAQSLRLHINTGRGCILSLLINILSSFQKMEPSKLMGAAGKKKKSNGGNIFVSTTSVIYKRNPRSISVEHHYFFIIPNSNRFKEVSAYE
jgi:hypothetical protein